VADYVIKQGQQDVNYVVSVIHRLYRNSTIKIVLVDDSRFSREHMANLLQIHRYQILQAANGEQALGILDAHPDVHLLITDFNMPGMNGDELTRRIRERYSHENLAIIGISALGNALLSAKFIKSGANDFITKPFTSEEFYCRVTQNVEMLTYIRTVRELSNQDYLTGLYHRRYLFETGGKLFASALRGALPLALGMVDIDDFKSINDQYGHDIGDMVLRRVSEILKCGFRESDIVVRYGGEEFCVLISNAQPANATIPFEKARLHISAAEIDLGEETLRITVSIGVCSQIGESLKAMISDADRLLFEAKKAGENRVVAG
jgi:diguanylate cyclase (GGDEF)-like protein